MDKTEGTFTSRPTRTDTLMVVAHAFAKRSTCGRLSVGAVIARDGRILATGYNGPAAGLPHCDHINGEPCDAAVHAEANVIAFAARYGIGTDNSILVCTHAPCLKCAQLIVNAGIRLVVYEEPYRDLSGIELLATAGIGCASYFPGIGDHRYV